LKVPCTARRDFQLSLACFSAESTKRIRAQLANGDLLERAVQVDRAFEEAPRAGVITILDVGAHLWAVVANFLLVRANRGSRRIVRATIGEVSKETIRVEERIICGSRGLTGAALASDAPVNAVYFDALRARARSW
jgi:hypothetical protein